jgi:hypothetical protein
MVENAVESRPIRAGREGGEDMLMRWTGLVAAVALWPVAALAQPVFFDDFDGPDLLPHWSVPPPENWEYNVSGGMLNVTDLHFPGIPHLESNFATIRASFETQTDFRLDVWMGWDREPAEQYDELAVGVMSPTGGIMAEFGLRYPGGPPVIGASAGAGSIRVPPPPPGMYQFTVTRIGSEFEFYLDGEHFGSLPDEFWLPAGGVRFFFSKPFPGEMNPYHVDRVRVVPTPGAVVVVSAVCVLACARRRR